MRPSAGEAARRKMRDGHRGGRLRVELTELPVADEEPEDLLALDDALAALEAGGPTAAAVVKSCPCTGLSVEEAAATLDSSHGHARRYWIYTRARLHGAGREPYFFDLRRQIGRERRMERWRNR